MPRALPPTNVPITLTAEGARANLLEIQRSEIDTVKPPCYSKLYESPTPTTSVLLMFHGLANCPAQFDTLGQSLAERGYTVFIPRLPGHGLVLEEGALGSITTQELIDYAEDMIAIASALGEEVTVVGLSAGGALTSYLAQRSPQVDKAVIIAPLFGLYGLPPALTDAITVIALDSTQVQKNAHHAPHGYATFSNKAVGAFLRLAEEILTDSEQNAPLVKDITLVSNENDDVINNEAIEIQKAAWSQYPDVSVSSYVFTKDQGFRHDLIDPFWQGDGLDTAVVYPVITELILE